MGSRKRPKPAPATAQEKAFARRSEVSLDKEIDEENRRKRQLLRNTLGTGTLLSGFNTSGGGGTAQFSGTSFTSNSGAPSTASTGSSTLGVTGGAGRANRGPSLLNIGR